MIELITVYTEIHGARTSYEPLRVTSAAHYLVILIECEDPFQDCGIPCWKKHGMPFLNPPNPLADND